jgi:crossover junction endodeoxyribonuclease RusA
MSEVRIALPFPPTVNNLFPTNRKTGKRYPSPEYKRFQKAMAACLTAQKIGQLPVPAVIKIALTPRDTRPRDADNYTKAILDCLVKGGCLPGDDSRYVKAISAYWENPSSKHSGALVMVRPANMEGKREALNAAERALLQRITSAGTLLVRPSSITGPMQSLIDKKYARELPGLINSCPQGFVAIEAEKRLGISP